MLPPVLYIEIFSLQTNKKAPDLIKNLGLNLRG